MARLAVTRIAAARARLGQALAPWAVPAALLIGWQVASSLGWIGSKVLPSPAEVGLAFWHLARTGELWQALGVSILHRLLVETLLCPPSPPETTYVHRVEEVVENLRGGQFPLAALLMPATVAHVRTISMSGERLPPKSTYFYPKLLSGLVINPLE